jgi:hypothetical protein
LTLDKTAAGEMTIDKMMVDEINVYEMIGCIDMMSVCQRKLQKVWENLIKIENVSQEQIVIR